MRQTSYSSIPFFLLLIILFAGCEKPIQNFDLKNHDPKIVINAVLSADSIASVHGSRSKDLFDPRNGKSLVKDLSVYISSGKDPQKLINTSEYLFKDETLVIRENTSYTLEASAPGYSSVSAQVTIPAKPAFAALDTSFKKTTYPGCFDCTPEYFFKTDLKIEDNQSSSDFYQIEFFLYEESLKQDSLIFWSDFSTISSSPFVEFSGSSYYLNPADINSESNGSSFYLSDQSFNGRTVSLSFFSNAYNLYYRPTRIVIGEEGKEEIEVSLMFLSVRLSRISKAYFYHLKGLANNNAMGDFPLTEPVFIPTNIENGLGVLGAKASVDTLISLGDVYRQIENIVQDDIYYY